jgi:hypothetical protein
MGRATAIAATALALAVAGCGGGDDKSAVESTIHSYLNAFVSGDGAKACSLMSDTTRTRFVARAGPVYKTGNCGVAIDKIRNQAGPAVLAALKGVKVSDVKVTGDTATAKLTSGKSFTSTTLVKQSGSWKVSAVPGAQ